MNIVLVDHYAGSPQLGMEYRPYYFAREWIKLGHKVIIVGGSYSHVRNRQPSVRRAVEKETIDDVEYFWIKTNTYNGNGLGRVWSMVLFSWRLYTKLPALLRTIRPDLIIASSTYPLENFPIKKLADRFNCKYCFEVHDLWPLSPMELGGMSKYHPFILLIQWAENFAYRHCDFVVSLLPAALPHMVSHGLKVEKFNYIPNGIVVEEWDDTARVPSTQLEQIQSIKNAFDFIVTYAGSHGLANSLDSFIDASKFTTHKIAFVLVGDGPEKKRLQNKVIEEEIGNVFFIDAIPKKSIPAMLKYFNALFIGLQKQSLFRFGISPNKLIDYMMASKPIIQGIDAGNNMVVEYECGVAVEPENPKAIADGIERIFNMSNEERDMLGSNGRAAALRFHNYKVLAKNFISIVK